MTENYISYDTYKIICKKEKLTEESSRSTLVDFLNDLGVAIHFKEFDLKDTHILEPRWITGAAFGTTSANVWTWAITSWRNFFSNRAAFAKSILSRFLAI